MTAQTEQEQAVGRCWECDYALRGLPTPRCPECGRAFDPADPTTMNMGTRIGPVARRLMRPPGWPVHVFTTLAILASLWTAATPLGPGQLVDNLGLLVTLRGWTWSGLLDTMATPGSIRGHYFLAFGLWLGVIAWWLVRRVARGVTVKRLSKQKAATFAYWRRWLLTPVLFAVTVLACMTNLPVLIGFALSKPGLQDAVRQVRAARRPEHVAINHTIGVYQSPPNTWIGGFVGQHTAGETWIWVQPSGAFVFRDNGQPPTIDPSRNWGTQGHAIVHHLWGGWFSIEFARNGEF